MEQAIPWGEVKLLQSWGGFLAFVAYIVHSAISFSPAVQLQIGKGLVALFAFETLLYLHMCLFSTLSVKEREILSVYAIMFAMLFGVYGIAVYKAM